MVPKKVSNSGASAELRKPLTDGSRWKVSAYKEVSLDSKVDPQKGVNESKNKIEQFDALSMGQYGMVVIGDLYTHGNEPLPFSKLLVGFGRHFRSPNMSFNLYAGGFVQPLNDNLFGGYARSELKLRSPLRTRMVWLGSMDQGGNYYSEFELRIRVPFSQRVLFESIFKEQAFGSGSNVGFKSNLALGVRFRVGHSSVMPYVQLSGSSFGSMVMLGGINAVISY